MELRKERLIGLDIYRILAVLFIFLFHSNIHLCCNYGVLTRFIRNGAVFMTAFFILSGYSLYLTYQNKDFSKIETIKKFYLKRFIGIIPLYYTCALLYIIFIGTDDIKTNLFLAPIEILCLQSTFSSIFNVSHNGGTWFVSCIAICYGVFPLIQIVTIQLKTKIKLIIVGVFSFVLLWSPVLVHIFNTTNIYSNQFFRILEFSIGVLLSSMQRNVEQNKYLKWICSRSVIVFEMIILILGVSIADYLGIAVQDYMLYSWIGLPIFSLQIISMAGIKSSPLKSNAIISYLCEISYAFFLSQFFTWKIAQYILKKIETEANIAKIVISFLTCMLISIILHESIEKPISKQLNRRFFRSQ